MQLAVRIIGPLLSAVGLLATGQPVPTARITVAGRPAALTVRSAGPHSVRVTLAPADLRNLPRNPALLEETTGRPALRLTELVAPRTVNVSGLRVDVRPMPLTVVVTNAKGQRVQELVFEAGRPPVVRARRSAGPRDG